MLRKRLGAAKCRAFIIFKTFLFMREDVKMATLPTPDNITGGLIKKAADAGDLAAKSAMNPNNPGLNAKARGIRGGVHYVPDPPTKHTGGPINKTAVYKLKKGEHVLAPEETEKVKKIAGLMNGIKSLGKR
jgi:hypothetical protein